MDAKVDSVYLQASLQLNVATCPGSCQWGAGRNDARKFHLTCFSGNQWTHITLAPFL